MKSATQMKPVTLERWQINGGTKQGSHWLPGGPGWCHTLGPTNISQRWKTLWAACLTPVPLLSPTDCTVFCSEQSLTVCLRRWILPEQGLGWLGQVTWMPCIAQGARGRLACMKHCLYYSSYPLDTGDRAAKCKPRAVKKSGVCVLTDRQLSLFCWKNSKARKQAPAATLPLNIYTQCMIALSKQGRLGQACV